MHVLNEFKYMKSVPTGRARKEYWQMLCERSGAGAQFVTVLLNSFYSYMYIPDGWQTSECVQLDKQNGKEGTKGIRLINLLCPLGKLFFKLVQQDLPDKRFHFGSGFYSHRRREQPLLIHHAVTGRIRQHTRELT